MGRKESPAEELTIKILYVEWVFLNADATGTTKRRTSYSAEPHTPQSFVFLMGTRHTQYLYYAFSAAQIRTGRQHTPA